MKQEETCTDLTKDAVFRVGSVVAVEGQTVKIKVDFGKNTSTISYKGEIIKNIAVGSFVEIRKGLQQIIGKIEGELIHENQLHQNSSYVSKEEHINRVLNIKIMGRVENGIFVRGMSELPLIDNLCYLISNQKFNLIHQFVDKDDKAITIGKLESDTGSMVSLGVNKLFASHIGIFGNTGSGKSYTLAKIYRELMKEYSTNKKFKDKSKFVIIDFNGEYIEQAIHEDKKSYALTTKNNGSEKYPIREEAMNDPTFWSIFLSATEKTQQPFIARTLKKRDIIPEDITTFIKGYVSSLDKTIDKSVLINFLYQVQGFVNTTLNIEELDSQLLHHSVSNCFYYKIPLVFANAEPDAVVNKSLEVLTNCKEITFRDLSKIEEVQLKLIFHYYNEIARGFSNIEFLSPLIKRLEKRSSDLEKVITTTKTKNSNTSNFWVISLRNVNMEIRKMLPMLLIKDMYDEHKEDETSGKSLHIIIDEAHNILSSSSDRESKEWKDYRLETFEEIIKEGRKFNVFMTIASQRPSDISATIISQLHNYFLHRLINNNDLLAIEKTIAYLDKVSADSIPNLETGTCILAGLMAKIPVVIQVGAIEDREHEPHSHNIDLEAHWEEDEEEWDYEEDEEELDYEEGCDDGGDEAYEQYKEEQAYEKHRED